MSLFDDMFRNKTLDGPAKSAANAADQASGFIDSRKKQLDDSYAAYGPQDFNAVGQQFVAANMPQVQDSWAEARRKARALYAGRGLSASSIAARGMNNAYKQFARQALQVGQGAQDASLQYQQGLAGQYGSLATLLAQAASPGTDAIASAGSQFAHSAYPTASIPLNLGANLLGGLSLNEQMVARGAPGLGFSIGDLFK